MDKHGILIISHGSKDKSWVAHVQQCVVEAKTQFYSQLSTNQIYTYDESEELFPIINSYLELVEGELIQDGIHALQNKGVTHITVLPLFVSAGSTHLEEIKQAFGYTPSYDFIGDLLPFEVNSKVTFDAPLIDDVELVQIVVRHIQEAMHIFKAEIGSVLILGHGSTHETYYKLWEEGMQQLIQKVELETSSIKIHYASLLPDTSVEKLTSINTRYQHVFVLPLFISPGYFTRKIIPNRLEGLPHLYSGQTLLPSEEMKNLLLRRYNQIYRKSLI